MPMLENKMTPEMKVKARFNSNAKSVHLQRLQDEIDKLALLVNEAKRQSDRIQAAADALGDSVFADLEATILPFPDRRSRQKKTDA